MKKSLWCLVLVPLLIMGCKNTTTFDFEDFVNQVSLEQPETLTLPWENTEAPVDIVEENINMGSAKHQPASDAKTLYSHTVKIQLGEGKEIEDLCVTGDAVVYWVSYFGENSIHITSVSQGGDEVIYSTRNEIYAIACGDGRIVWVLYNLEESAFEMYIYEKGEIILRDNLKGIQRLDELHVDGNYVIGFRNLNHIYTYNIVQDELTEIIDEDSEYILRWDYEDGYGGFACENDHIKIKDVYGKVVYEKQLERLELMYHGNKNMIVLQSDSEGNVYVDTIDGEDYSVNYEADNVVVTGNWVYMFNSLRNSLQVFNPDYPDLIWEMSGAKVSGFIRKADKGQLVFYSGGIRTRTVTVYTMK